MSLWITCDADGCDARCEAAAYEGRERGEVEVSPDEPGWFNNTDLTYNKYRIDVCPQHRPRCSWWMAWDTLVSKGRSDRLELTSGITYNRE